MDKEQCLMQLARKVRIGNRLSVQTKGWKKGPEMDGDPELTPSAGWGHKLRRHGGTATIHAVERAPTGGGLRGSNA
jgi:hypothetical protein